MTTFLEVTHSRITPARLVSRLVQQKENNFVHVKALTIKVAHVFTNILPSKYIIPNG